MTVGTTHLTYLRPIELRRRRLERLELIKFLPKERAVVGGDLNTFGIPFAKIHIVNQGYSSQVSGKTWQWRPEKIEIDNLPIETQLDYVFATNDIDNLVSAQIMEESLSDHRPLLVRL